LAVHADIDALLRVWGEEKTALIVCLSAWMHKINQLDEIHQFLIEHDHTDYASAPIWMIAGLVSEGHLFFSKKGKVSTYFQKEILADAKLRDAVAKLRKFHSRPTKGTPEMNMVRHLRNKYSFHPNEYNAVSNSLQYWRRCENGNGQPREMAIYRIDCERRPHFDARGCDALYLMGLFDFATDSSLVISFGELISRLGKDVAKLRNLTGDFFICLGEYLERQQPRSFGD
jgi:hypothetical protein